MNEIPKRDWTGDARIFELVHEWQSVWGGHPYGTEIRHNTSQIYLTNTIGVNQICDPWRDLAKKRYECRHVLHIANKHKAFDYISSTYWLSDEYVNHVLGKKEMDFSGSNYVRVTLPNLYFYVGQILRRTSEINEHANHECVITVGQYYDWSGGRQHDDDGQRICLNRDFLAEITKQTQD